MVECIHDRLRAHGRTRHDRYGAVNEPRQALKGLGLQLGEVDRALPPDLEQIVVRACKPMGRDHPGCLADGSLELVELLGGSWSHNGFDE
jgi:hypothetical protein